MATVTLSPKFQIVIPREVREALKISSGRKFEVIPYGDRIELIPLDSLESLKGSLRGMNTSIQREKDRL